MVLSLNTQFYPQQSGCVLQGHRQKTGRMEKADILLPVSSGNQTGRIEKLVMRADAMHFQAGSPRIRHLDSSSVAEQGGLGFADTIQRVPVYLKSRLAASFRVRGGNWPGWRNPARGGSCGASDYRPHGRPSSSDDRCHEYNLEQTTGRFLGATAGQRACVGHIDLEHQAAPTGQVKKRSFDAAQLPRSGPIDGSTCSETRFRRLMAHVRRYRQTCPVFRSFYGISRVR